MSGIKQTIHHGYDEKKTADLVIDSIDKVLETNHLYPIEITFRPKDNKRSDAQNRFLWAMFSEIAGEMTRITNGKFTYTKDDAHDLMLQSILGVRKRMVGKTEVITQVKTAEMSQAEAIEFITACLAWATAKGMRVMMPKEYLEWARGR